MRVYHGGSQLLTQIFFPFANPQPKEDQVKALWIKPELGARALRHTHPAHTGTLSGASVPHPEMLSDLRTILRRVAVI